ncbi:isochorismatase family protein [Kribbella sp. NPDC051586]|uniref:isochorismatase family protein n=1 Tax=Kribbella sp. NPDC051586 TaxID=3364118 RepID=UPI0037B6D5AD
MNTLEARRTALILIDLMPRIVALETAPHSGPAVLERSVALAAATRKAGGLVVNVRVERPGVDVQPEGSGFAPTAEPQPGDLEIVKRAIGAFGRTSLDAELQSRGIANVALAGIATNFGVESTARAASDLGYETFFITDAMTGLDEHAHNFALSYAFPRIGETCTTEEFLKALSQA